MTLDKINDMWKRLVNTGPHGRCVVLHGSDVDRVDKRFWKQRRRTEPVFCDTAEKQGREQRRSVGPLKAELYGPKSRQRCYVCFKIEPRCHSNADLRPGIRHDPVMKFPPRRGSRRRTSPRRSTGPR